MEALRAVMGDGDERQMVTRLVSRVSALEAALAAANASRRELHNRVVQLKGNVSQAVGLQLRIEALYMLARQTSGAFA